ncbi:Dps family protein [Rhizosphaericola mali]|uniref:DNA starvation/stationary phase protection protein n=1 Tax=Rhizosphaericola mali TaxID=2545455 RepID=A0A5P2G086_9BACT|nr:DNA starvation/stationary phase protection protein [Rhizosphaericola mali]QES87210.1 DNA starvation/stationary phase protection protein [Rhizosphaericola mali]
MAKKADVLDSIELNYAPINIGISDKNAQIVANKLQILLADEEVLYAKTRNYHWNIEGPNFMEIHKFYESLYTELAETIDEVAERIRKIGHYAQGRMQDFLEQARLLEGDYTNDQKTQMQNLLEDHETLAREIREDISEIDEKYKDTGTSDFLTGLLKDHERWAWFLRSYLGGKK